MIIPNIWKNKENPNHQPVSYILTPILSPAASPPPACAASAHGAHGSEGSGQGGNRRRLRFVHLGRVGGISLISTIQKSTHHGDLESQSRSDQKNTLMMNQQNADWLT